MERIPWEKAQRSRVAIKTTPSLPSPLGGGLGWGGMLFV
jgi:hypothetical protein